MHKVIIGNEILSASKDDLLADILIKNKKMVEHPCGGKGSCQKCKVLVNGKEELSCQYKITSDISVSLFKEEEIVSEIGKYNKGNLTDSLCFVLDIGTTTLALALVSLDSHQIVDVITGTNPQRMFGADIMTRIDYCQKNSVGELHTALISEINQMLKHFHISQKLDMYIAGNTTMLHTFFNVDCSSIGVAPYHAKFLDSQKSTGSALGLQNIDHVVSLPGIHSFVGADLVAGMNYIGMPADGKYNLLVDLGTNAEIILFSKESALCTAAAAGPCFEGANITCGMSATNGAIFSCSCEECKHLQLKTIGDAKAKGICGTGLIDIVATLLECDVIDETGYMECEDYLITEQVYLSNSDVRQFQLAKSAIFSAIKTLLEMEEITFDQVETLYISGGFSAKIDVENAIKTGLLPAELKEKCVSINNSSLLGTMKFVCENNDLSLYLENSKYVDLAASKTFTELFIQNMMF